MLLNTRNSLWVPRFCVARRTPSLSPSSVSSCPLWMILRADGGMHAWLALLHLLQQPTFQLFAGGQSKLKKTNATAPGSITPGDFGLGRKRDVRAGQRKLDAGDVSGERRSRLHCHAAFAQVAGCDLHLLGAAESEDDGNVYGQPEVTAPLAMHQPIGGVKGAQGIGGGDGFLQHKPGTHLERGAHIGDAVEN